MPEFPPPPPQGGVKVILSWAFAITVTAGEWIGLVLQGALGADWESWHINVAGGLAAAFLSAMRGRPLDEGPLRFEEFFPEV